MQGRRKITAQGIEAIKRREGLSLTVYRDHAQLAVGYGHMVTASDKLKLGDRISSTRANEMLVADLKRFESVVNEVAVNQPLKPHQFDALVSFAFTIGENRLRGSTLARLLREGDINGAGEQMLRWVNAGGQRSNGLIRRRDSEFNQFTNGY